MSEKERTLSLLRAAKTGDNDAMSELVRENMGLVKSIALVRHRIFDLCRAYDYG